MTIPVHSCIVLQPLQSVTAMCIMMSTVNYIKWVMHNIILKSSCTLIVHRMKTPETECKEQNGEEKLTIHSHMLALGDVAESKFNEHY